MKNALVVFIVIVLSIIAVQTSYMTYLLLRPAPTLEDLPETGGGYEEIVPKSAGVFSSGTPEMEISYQPPRVKSKSIPSPTSTGYSAPGLTIQVRGLERNVQPFDPILVGKEFTMQIGIHNYGNSPTQGAVIKISSSIYGTGQEDGIWKNLDSRCRNEASFLICEFIDPILPNQDAYAEMTLTGTSITQLHQNRAVMTASNSQFPNEPTYGWFFVGVSQRPTQPRVSLVINDQKVDYASDPFFGDLELEADLNEPFSLLFRNDGLDTAYNAIYELDPGSSGVFSGCPGGATSTTCNIGTLEKGDELNVTLELTNNPTEYPLSRMTWWNEVHDHGYWRINYVYVY